MWFCSGYRNYFSFGKDLEVMANNLLQKYNSYCTKEWKINSLEDMLNEELVVADEWKFLTYIVDINSASDDDCRTFANEIYLGDYLEVIREKCK